MSTLGFYKFLTAVLCLLIISSSSSLFAGLLQGTVITTLTGSRCVEGLQKGDTICGYDLEKKTSAKTTIIENIECHSAEGIYIISTTKGIIAASAEQLFFEAKEQVFIPIVQFKVGDKLLTKDGEELECLAIEYRNVPIRVYDLSLPEPHLFFSSDARVLTHNVDPIATPLLLYWGAQVLPVIVEAVVAASATFILAQGTVETFMASSESKKSGSKKSSQHKKISFWRKLKFWKKTRRSSDVLYKDADRQSSTELSRIISNNIVMPNPDPDDDPNDPKKKEGKDEEKKIKIFENNAQHIFRKKQGHFELDTPENRKLIEDMVNDERNYLGPDSYGKKSYAKILDNGKQLWAEVRGNSIRNAGVNDTPKKFDPITGLSRNINNVSNL